MTEKERRTKKYMQDIRHKKRLERMAHNCKAYPAAAFWVDEKYNVKNGKYEDIPKPYAKKMYLSSNCERYRYYKRYSNRKVRRTFSTIGRGNGYRKIFDYKWEID
jgi:hypothetical protein